MYYHYLMHCEFKLTPGPRPGFETPQEIGRTWTSATREPPHLLYTSGKTVWHHDIIHTSCFHIAVWKESNIILYIHQFIHSEFKMILNFPFLLCAEINKSDQVSALWTAWGQWMWRGIWRWRSDWPTAGVCTARVVKVCGQGGERACGRWSILAQFVLKCLEWTSMSLLNVQCCVRTHVLPFRLNIRCAGCGWGRNTLGCSPSTICYCCAMVKPPSWGKTRSSWSHSSPLKRWQDESSLVSRMSIAMEAVS